MKEKNIRLPRYLMKLASGVVMLGLCSMVTARADDTSENRGQFSASDYKFAAAAAQGGAFEVELGDIAQKSTDNAVKQFGARMMNDHGKADKQLTDLAGRKTATLPAGVSEAQQKEVDRLTLLTGPDFDRAYISLMVKAHKADLKAFKKAADDAQDPDLKAFAAGLVPVIQDHLSMAESLDQTLKPGMSMNRYQPL